jgi:hypothetical protein
MMPISGSDPSGSVNAREVAADKEFAEASQKVQAFRKKLEKHINAKTNSLTPQNISESLVKIQEYLAAQAPDRVGLESIGPLFRRNKDSAPPSAAIQAKMKEIVRRFQKEASKE